MASHAVDLVCLTGFTYICILLLIIISSPLFCLLSIVTDAFPYSSIPDMKEWWFFSNSSLRSWVSSLIRKCDAVPMLVNYAGNCDVISQAILKSSTFSKLVLLQSGWALGKCVTSWAKMTAKSYRIFAEIKPTDHFYSEEFPNVRDRLRLPIRRKSQAWPT